MEDGQGPQAAGQLRPPDAPVHPERGQLVEFPSYEVQEMQISEKIVPLKIDLRVSSAVVRDQFFWIPGYRQPLY